MQCMHPCVVACMCSVCVGMHAYYVCVCAGMYVYVA
jgi:hypothetical protein